MIRKLFVLLALFALQACGPGSETDFDTWDINDDGEISRGEFEQVWDQEEYYSQWDTNEDGMVQPDEWNLGLQNIGYDSGHPIGGRFEYWDADDNRMLDEEELRSNLFDYWDKNDDGKIDKVEFENRFA